MSGRRRWKMSVYYNLEFYIKRQPLSKELLEDIFSALQKNGISYSFFTSVANDRTYIFATRNIHASDHSYVQEAEKKLTDEEKIVKILADADTREFGLVFGIGSEDFDAYMAIRNNGRNRKGKCTRETLKNCIYGNIVVRWDEMHDLEYSAGQYAKTVEIIPDLYEAIHPVYGYGCDEELMEERFYNLRPTEENIAGNGPKDLLDINIWNPEIVSKLDLSRLKRETSLSIVEMKDGGAFIHISPEDFMSGNRRELVRAEQALGWYRDHSDVRTI
jgi:hypothetical protein